MRSIKRLTTTLVVATSIMLLIFGSAFAAEIDYCHKHTGNGLLWDEFNIPRTQMNLTLSAKAPASGDIWAYVDAGGMNIVGEVNKSDGAEGSTKINFTDLGGTNEFGSQVSNYASGTGYASLIGPGATHSACIPDTPND